MGALKKVSLKNALGPEEFDFLHAERILKRQAEKGQNAWALNDAKLEFKDGHIIKRTGAGANQNAEEQD